MYRFPSFSFPIIPYDMRNLPCERIKRNQIMGAKAGGVGGSTSLEAVGEAVGAAVEGVVTTAETGLFRLTSF